MAEEVKEVKKAAVAPKPIVDPVAEVVRKSLKSKDAEVIEVVGLDKDRLATLLGNEGSVQVLQDTVFLDKINYGRKEFRVKPA